MQLRYDRSIVENDLNTLQEIIDVPMNVHTCRLRHENLDPDGNFLNQCPIRLVRRRIGCAHSVIRNDVYEMLGRFCEWGIIDINQAEQWQSRMKQISNTIGCLDNTAYLLVQDGRETFPERTGIPEQYQTLDGIREQHTLLTRDAHAIVVDLFKAGKKFLQSPKSGG